MVYFTIVGLLEKDISIASGGVYFSQGPEFFFHHEMWLTDVKMLHNPFKGFLAIGLYIEKENMGYS